MIKGLIQDKDIILDKTDALNSGAPTYIKLLLLLSCISHVQLCATS